MCSSWLQRIFRREEDMRWYKYPNPQTSSYFPLRLERQILEVLLRLGFSGPKKLALFQHSQYMDKQ
jgi:hypothetical protein